jgi:phosphate-selective porin OprO/OprP
MFGRIVPKANFSSGLSSLGAIELGLRYSQFDSSDFLTSARGYVAGSGCLTTPNARILLNYVYTNFETPVIINSKSGDSEKALTARAQYDF